MPEGSEKILVTGGTGFLGKSLHKVLENHGYEVVTTDVNEGGIRLDVTNMAEVTQVIKEYSPDVIVHLAALVAGAPSIKRPYEYYRVNVLGALNVFEAARELGTRKVIHMSSFSIFGRTEILNEDTPPAPENPYGGSKAAAEYIARIYAKLYAIKTIIFRAPLLAGKGQTEYNAMQEFVDCALNEHPIVILGDGDHLREWLHPEDVAQAIAKGVRFFDRMNKPWEVFTLGSGCPVTMNELAKRVIFLSNSTVNIIHKQALSPMFNQVSDTTKVQRLLGWKPAINLDEIILGIADTRAPTGFCSTKISSKVDIFPGK